MSGGFAVSYAGRALCPHSAGYTMDHLKSLRLRHVLDSDDGALGTERPTSAEQSQARVMRAKAREYAILGTKPDRHGR